MKIFSTDAIDNQSLRYRIEMRQLDRFVLRHDVHTRHEVAQ
jgi:hypothetical protein